MADKELKLDEGWQKEFENYTTRIPPDLALKLVSRFQKRAIEELNGELIYGALIEDEGDTVYNEIIHRTIQIIKNLKP